MSRKKLYKEFSGWLVANLFLPLVIPFVILLICGLFAEFIGEKEVFSDFKILLDKLLDKGVYSFLSISLLLSIFQDYKTARNVIKLELAAVLFLFLLLLGFLFLWSLEIITPSYEQSEIRSMFIYLSLSSAVFAMILKIMIIKNKIRQLYNLL